MSAALRTSYCQLSSGNRRRSGMVKEHGIFLEGLKRTIFSNGRAPVTSSCRHCELARGGAAGAGAVTRGGCRSAGHRATPALQQRLLPLFCCEPQSRKGCFVKPSSPPREQANCKLCGGAAAALLLLVVPLMMLVPVDSLATAASAAEGLREVTPLVSLF